MHHPGGDTYGRRDTTERVLVKDMKPIVGDDTQTLFWHDIQCASKIIEEFEGSYVVKKLGSNIYKSLREKREKRAFQEQGALGLILELEKRLEEIAEETFKVTRNRSPTLTKSSP
ncbi:hypothetical protein Lal_00026613 [Lupinus albus]|nr:hypothetical protein Lal_00026613 [Lupinus albus]